MTRRKQAASKAVARRRRSPRRATGLDEAGAAFCAAAETALKRGELGAIPDALLRCVLTAAVKVYAAKVEAADNELPPFEDQAVTATETVVAACAMIRAADLNLFDVAMWFRRPVAGL